MNFVESATNWLPHIYENPIAPGFRERLIVATNAGRLDHERSIAAPYYLTDLGVRRFDDPKLFLDGHLALHGDEYLSRQIDDNALLLETPIAELGYLLDAFILFTGDYETGSSVIRERYDDILTNGSAAALIQSGVLLAALSDEGAREMFEHAAVRATDPTRKFMALHRLAAAEIKRFNRPEVGVRILERIDNAISDSFQNGEISAGDNSALTSVISNLRALAYIQLKRFGDARTEITRSHEYNTIEDLRVVQVDEAARYGSQVKINVAQTLLQSGNEGAAIQALQDNVAYCRTNNREYLSEALSALAYCQFITQQYSDAINSAKESAYLLSFEASPTRLRTARDIIIASYYKLDDFEGATEALRIAEADPLGLTLSSENESLCL